MPDYTILHHGAIDGVTGSCHQLKLADGRSLLVDCGLFQGAEVSADGAGSAKLAIDFPLTGVQALVVTHVHIDHVAAFPTYSLLAFVAPSIAARRRRRCCRWCWKMR
jgi:metallo-beta-lactamase family protein